MQNHKIAPFLNVVIKHNASDLHLVAGDKPSIRVDGKLIKLNYHNLSGKEIEELCFSFLTNIQIEKLKTKGEIDGVFAFNKKARFRFNIYKTLGEISAALRLIPTKIPTLQELQAPDIFKEFIKLHRGLILVTGPTGSGKTTTLASMLYEINKTQKRHIITIEDPVEFLHTPILSIVSHKEVGNDTKNFNTGLKYALRQDPDIIFIGEMRDKKTFAAALTAAETGHLVFATLHTNSSSKSINRIINSFEASKQNQIRAMLASSLKAVISQTLLPKIGGGRVVAWEILINNHAISNLIREQKIHQIYSTMQLNQSYGMQTQTKNLINLINWGIIDIDTAINYAFYPEELKRQLGIFKKENK